MDSSNDDRTASLMTPAKLAQVSAARKPFSPTAFLDQMAADAGHQHVTRLSELQADLQEQAGASRGPDIQPVLERIAQALPSLDFSLLQSQGGLWASLTGKNRNAGAGFATQVEGIDALVKALPAELALVGRQQQPHAAASDRSLVELEVEYRALDKIIDQGARWLQDMRNQIKTREAQAGADAEAQAQIRDDAARCETLVARLKALRACVAAARQVHQQVSAVADRRATLLAGLQKAMGGEAKEWRSRLGTLAGAAAEGKVAGLNLDGPRDAHKALRRRLDKLLAECEQLRTQEEALAHSLTSLGEQLSAAN